MTTTPYDAEIGMRENAFRATGPKAQVADDRYHLFVLRCKADGYRQAKAEDAPLLVALRVGLRSATCPCCGRDNDLEARGCTSDDCPGVQAIAAAEGRTP